jgi:hypothetical protein
VCLPGKCKALNSNPSTAKKKEQEEEGKEDEKKQRKKKEREIRKRKRRKEGRKERERKKKKERKKERKTQRKKERKKRKERIGFCQRARAQVRVADAPPNEAIKTLQRHPALPSPPKSVPGHQPVPIIAIPSRSHSTMLLRRDISLA